MKHPARSLVKTCNFDKFSVTDLMVDSNNASIGYSTLKLNKQYGFYKMMLNKYWNALAEKHSVFQ